MGGQALIHWIEDASRKDYTDWVTSSLKLLLNNGSQPRQKTAEIRFPMTGSNPMRAMSCISIDRTEEAFKSQLGGPGALPLCIEFKQIGTLKPYRSGKRHYPMCTASPSVA